MTIHQDTNHQSSDYAIVPAADFHFLTPLYDSLCVLFGLGRGFQRGVVERLALIGTERVLDIGCGTGMLLDELTRRYPRTTATGVDVDAGVLRIAGRRLNRKKQRAELYCAKAESLPLSDARIDMAVSTLAFHHLPRGVKHSAAREILRVLKPGGRFTLVDFGARPGRRVPWWQRLIERVDYLEDHVCGRLSAILSEAGFVHIELIDRRWPAIEYLVASKAR